MKLIFYPEEYPEEFHWKRGFTTSVSLLAHKDLERKFERVPIGIRINKSMVWVVPYVCDMCV